jgi:hypothetical protein
MKKTVEEPDLVPGSRGLHWTPRLGRLKTAIVLFSIRSLTRSRQHRVAFAFYLAVVFAIALSTLQTALEAGARRPLSMNILIATYMMMTFAVVGLRSVFSLPISLTANWVLRTTQISRTETYIEGTRGTLILFAVTPVWVISAGLASFYTPLPHVAAHLAVLALLGWALVELCLISFYKVPFTCSYLPGKSNVQFVFWGFAIGLLPFAVLGAEYEMHALDDGVRTGFMIGFLVTLAANLWAFNCQRARSAVLYFEELPEVVIQTLGLSG